MKKLIFLIAIIYFPVSDCIYSQSGWMQQQSGVNVSLNSIYFVNSNTGWICGDSGKILKTSNGGNNWMLQNTPTNYPLLSIFFLNENTGWCSGGTGDFNLFPNRMIVLKTTNGGSIWTTAYFSNSSYSCFASIYFIDALHGSVVEQGGTGSGTVGGLWITSNGGYNWQPVLSGLPAYRDLQFTDSNTGWVLGFYGDDTGHDTSYIGKSINGGLNWTTLFQRSKINLHSSYFINNNTGWISGLDREVSPYIEMIMKTTDGGMNFTRYNLENNIYINSIFFTDVNNGWGCSGRIYRTTNSGINWTMQLDYIGYSYNSIFFTDSLNGWVAGYNGIIFSTRTGGINSVNNPNQISPQTFSLSQNYPNPFNPSTIINYDIPSNVKGQTSNVKLIVYDILGNEITKLVDQNLQPGSYDVEFNGTNFSSGIYYYKLEAGNFYEVRKMILTK